MKLEVLLISVTILFINTAHGQQSVSYFADSLKTGTHSKIFCAEQRNEFIYVGGQSFDSPDTPFTPSLVKLDTSGKTIWTCSLNKQIDSINALDGSSLYERGAVKNLVTDSAYIYAHGYGYATTDFATIDELWKVDQLTGNTVWKKKITDAIILKNADKNHMIFTYNTYYGYTYEMADKTSGQTVMTQLLTSSPQDTKSGTITVDTDGTTYISRGDSLFSYSSPMLSQLKWAVKTGTPGSVYVMMPNEDGYIYIGGSGTFFFIGRIKKLDGQVGWIAGSNLDPRFLEDYVTDLKIKGNYVYANGQQLYVGSVYSAFHVCKYNRQTGELLWETNFNPDYNPNQNPEARYAGANSIVIDEQDNVYASGYEDAEDTKTAVWGICKFNSDGKLVYNTSLYAGYEPYAYSRGVFSFEFNHRLFHLGELQKSAPTQNPYFFSSWGDITLVATDTSGFYNPSNEKRTVATYQEFSEVKQIEPFSTSKYLVYKKLGNHAVVEMKKSADNSLIWSQSFIRDFHSEADKICVTALWHLRQQFFLFGIKLF